MVDDSFCSNGGPTMSGSIHCFQDPPRVCVRRTFFETQPVSTRGIRGATHGVRGGSGRRESDTSSGRSECHRNGTSPTRLGRLVRL